MPRYTYGPQVKKRVKRLLEALLCFVDGEFEDGDFGITFGWEEEDSNHPKLIVRTKLRTLENLIQNDNHPDKLTKQQIREALNLLKDFLKILEDNRPTKRGSEDWHFKLKLWSQNKDKNLQQFDSAWESHRPDKSKALEENFNKFKSSTNSPHNQFNWQDICRTMLEKHKRLTTDEMLYADEENKFDLNKIHVPLALVERTKPEKRRGDIQPEEGSRLYEPSYEEKQQFKHEDFLIEKKQQFEHEDFLTQVLRNGVGKTKGRRIALIGEPGAGKTTLLQTIAFWILDQNQDLAIWISLADLQSKSIEEYLLQNWLKNALEVTRVKPEQEDALAELFKKNKVWLLLDGADEMSFQKPLKEIEKQLEGWVKNARVVLSCRLNVWEANTNALHDFETYRLLDFDYPEQVKQFIDNWFKSKTSQEASKSNVDTGGHKGERLWDELNQPERQRIQDLVKNPLRLSLLCATWQSSAEGLPKTKAGLYHLFIKRFYTWKENRFPTNEQQQEQLNAVLSHLAKRAIDQETSRFRLQHKLLTEELGDPKQEGSNFWLALRLGWLNKVGLAAESDTEEEVYAFYHPTFQEYFAALAIDNWNSFLKHIPENPSDCYANYRIFEPQWKEVILLWLGREDILNTDKENFIKALVDLKDGCGEWINIDKVNKGFYEFQAYFLATQGITEFKNFSLSTEVVKQIVRYSFGYLNTKTQEQWESFLYKIRNEALDILLTTNKTKAIEGLIAVIRDPQLDSDTREWAAEKLEEIDPGNQIVIEGLIAVIRDPQVDSDTRSSAVFSLWEIDPDNQTVIEGLIAVIRDPQADSNTRGWAAGILGRIDPGNQIAIEELIAVIRDSQVDSDTFESAADSLEDIGVGNQKVIEGLIAVIRDPQVSGSICVWMSEILEENGVGNQKVIEGLITVIRDPQEDSYTRGLAASILGKIGVGNQIEIEGLMALIRDPQVDSYALHWAAESLGKIDPGNQTAIEELIAVIRDPQVDSDTHRMVSEVLEKIGVGNQTAIERLIAVIRDLHVNTDTRMRAAKILRKIVVDRHMVYVVSVLKNCLSYETYKNNFELFNTCYSIIWDYAKKMTYPNFYHAWFKSVS